MEGERGGIGVEGGGERGGVETGGMFLAVGEGRS